MGNRAGLSPHLLASARKARSRTYTTHHVQLRYRCKRERRGLSTVHWTSRYAYPCRVSSLDCRCSKSSRCTSISSKISSAPGSVLARTSTYMICAQSQAGLLWILGGLLGRRHSLRTAPGLILQCCQVDQRQGPAHFGHLDNLFNPPTESELRARDQRRAEYVTSMAHR